MALDRPEILHSIGLVVVDEVHFITDPMQGITVELILTHLILARTKGINSQIVCLSAVVGDVNNFDDWLECRKIISTKRPIPLIEGVIDRKGVYRYIDVDGVVRTEQFIPAHEIRQRKSEPISQDIIVPLAKKLLIDNEKIIFFRNVRGSAQGCAAYLAADLNLALALPLMAIPGIRRGEILALHSAGINSPDQLKSLSEKNLLEILGQDNRVQKVMFPLLLHLFNN